MRFRNALAATVLASTTTAVEVNLQSEDSIKAAASELTYGLMTWYTGNETGMIPGNLNPPDVYYWWMAGAMMGTLMDYWYYTGDSTYNNEVTQAMLWQVGPTNDYMPPNQTKTEGNDDQAFWGFAAMTAAEYKFPNPPPDQPQWLALAQGVWNSQQLRWDTQFCDGGLRWQIFPWNNGYDYKNTPSNAGFINLGARLYAYTGNETYADWTVKAWNWLVEKDLITTDAVNPPAWRILDGTYIVNNCTGQNPIQWSYNVAMLLNAAAVMWNVTQDPVWEERVNGIWGAAGVFFHDKIMFEAACEGRGNCNADQHSFKAYLARFMAASTKWMPDLLPQFQPYFQASAEAAMKVCTGTNLGVVGTACGFNWASGVWDGQYIYGPQMGAIEVLLANTIQGARHPVTDKEGGISEGDPSAGTQGDGTTTVIPYKPVTTGDKAGAGILTAVVLVAWLGGAWWMVS